MHNALKNVDKDLELSIVRGDQEVLKQKIVPPQNNIPSNNVSATPAVPYTTQPTQTVSNQSQHFHRPYLIPDNGNFQSVPYPRPQVSCVFQPLNYNNQSTSDTTHMTVSTPVEESTSPSKASPSKPEEQDRPYKCSYCTKSFTKMCNLERHTNSHLRVKLHQCDICSKTFARTDILAVHKRTHSAERPHKCSLCDATFACRTNMILHEKRTHAEKHYQCPKCQEKFTDADKLKRHYRAHSSNRRFKCTKCPKRFINSSNLKTHLRIHTQERPYTCEKCGMGFIQKQHLLRHVKIHTKPPPPPPPVPITPQIIRKVPERPIQCKRCDKSFTNVRGLSLHDRMKHRTNNYKAKAPPRSANGSRKTAESIPPVHSAHVSAINEQVMTHPVQVFVDNSQVHHDMINIHVPQHQQHQQEIVVYPAPSQPMHYNSYNPHHHQQQYQSAQSLPVEIQVHQQLGQQDDPNVIFTTESYDTILSLIQAANATLETPAQASQNQNVPVHPVHLTSVPHPSLQQVHRPMMSHSPRQQLQFQGPRPYQNNPYQPIQQPQQLSSSPPQHVQQNNIHQQAPVQNIYPAKVVTPRKPPKSRPRVEKTGSGDKPYSCRICNRSFSQSGVLVKHIRTHTGEKPHKCHLCSASFSQGGNLNRHLKSHRGEKSYACGICNQQFTRQERMMYHMKIHTNERNFCCTEEGCNKRFIDQQGLNKHVLRNHSGERPFQCTYQNCTKAFCEKRELERHIVKHSLPRPFKCEKCSRCFSDKKILERHFLLHTGERPFSCSICERRYPTNTSLYNHMKKHQSTNEYKCPHCDKVFKEKSSLKAHKKSHSDDKPFKCTECKKVFKASSSLSAHMRIHTGEKPYACNVDGCGAAFVQKAHLLRHTKKCYKQGSKILYQCSICNKMFSSISSLMTHSANRHAKKDKRHRCEICSKKFTKALHLKRHIATHHETENDDEIIPEETPAQAVCTEAKNDENLNSSTLCDNCGGIFSSSKDLKTHKEEFCSRLKCEVCHLKFDKKQLLELHERTHFGVNAHGCDLCDSSYKTLGGLKRHKEANHGDKPLDNGETLSEDCEALLQEQISVQSINPTSSKSQTLFDCSECDKLFLSSSNLTQHMRTHTGEKPFKCVGCHRKFTQKQHAQRHALQCSFIKDLRECVDSEQLESVDFVLVTETRDSDNNISEADSSSRVMSPLPCSSESYDIISPN